MYINSSLHWNKHGEKAFLLSLIHFRSY